MSKTKDSTRISFKGHKLKDILKDLLRVKPPQEKRQDQGGSQDNGNEEPKREKEEENDSE